jgi:GrpB-like predicted nucleotidyltransferase (UPF0157 family)
MCRLLLEHRTLVRRLERPAISIRTNGPARVLSRSGRPGVGRHLDATSEAAAAAPNPPLSSYAGLVPNHAAPNRAVLVPYDSSWGPRGIALAQQLQDTLAPMALRVEHIGSTAIPGMAAKPVFDLQVSVEDLDQAAHAFERPLAGHGFLRLPYEQDHVPAGYNDDPARWAKRLWARRQYTEEDINLHVRLYGAPNERLALLFRDWFRAHPEAIPSYARFKQVLAQSVVDIDTYAEVKDPVVDLVIAVAESWARGTGWTP